MMADDAHSITLGAKALAAAMHAAAGIVASSQVIPILANVRLTARAEPVDVSGAGSLEIVTSDLDTEYRQVLPLDVPGAFSTTVDARRLSAIAGAAEPGAQISLSLAAANGGGARLTVKTGRSRWSLPVLPADDFPLMPDGGFETGPMLEIPGAVLARAIARTRGALSSEITQPWYMGICLHDRAGQVTLAAADGHLMLVAPVSPIGGGGQDWPKDAPPAIVPAKLIKAIEKLCAERDEVVSLWWDDRKLRAEIGATALTGKLIADYNFPPYEKFLPTGCEATIVDPAALIAAVRRIGLVANKQTNGIKLERAPDKLTLSMACFDTGEATEEVPANCTLDFVSGFRGELLARLLDAIGGDSIEILQADGLSPALFRRVVDDGALALCGAFSV